jgi:hypothetical protein
MSTTKIILDNIISFTTTIHITTMFPIRHGIMLRRRSNANLRPFIGKNSFAFVILAYFIFVSSLRVLILIFLFTYK